MAANHKAELTEIEQVMKFYELHAEKALFVIYAGIGMQYNNICFDFLDEEQPENGAEYLRQFLELIKSRVDNTNVYTIQLVDGFKEVETKTGKQKVFTGRNLRFQLNQPAPYNAPSTKEIFYPNMPTLPINENSEVTNLLKNLLEEQKKENERLKELLEQNNNYDYFEDNEEEEEGEEQPTPPPTPKERVIGVISGLMERDEVQEAIAGILVSGQKWLTKKVFKQGDNE